METAVSTEEKVSQVAKQTDLLFSQVSKLESEITALHNSLSKVLRDPGPVPEGNVDQPDELVPLAKTIRDAADYVESLNSSVRDILERLEV